MKIAFRIFLTYASISMFSGIMYAFVYAGIAGISHISIEVFLFL